MSERRRSQPYLTRDQNQRLATLRHRCRFYRYIHTEIYLVHLYIYIYDDPQARAHRVRPQAARPPALCTLRGVCSLILLMYLVLPSSFVFCDTDLNIE